MNRILLIVLFAATFSMYGNPGSFSDERPNGDSTFYVGTIKGGGSIYQQMFVDTYSKVAQAKLYTTKTPITAADLLMTRLFRYSRPTL